MAPFWCFLAVVAFVIATIAALTYRERALQAERRAEANLDSLQWWQRQASEWSEEARKWEAYFEGLEADLEAHDEEDDDGDDTPPEYRGDEHWQGPENAAQMFSYANEAFYYHLLNWNPRHD